MILCHDEGDKHESILIRITNCRIGEISTLCFLGFALERKRYAEIISIS